MQSREVARDRYAAEPITIGSVERLQTMRCDDNKGGDGVGGGCVVEESKRRRCRQDLLTRTGRTQTQTGMADRERRHQEADVVEGTSATMLDNHS